MNRRTDRGSAAVELAMAAPVLILAALLMAAAGRVVSTAITVEAAAHAAARAASLHTRPEHARAAAHDTAGAVLADSGYSCATHTLTVDTSALTGAAVPGRAVRTRLTCQVALADFAPLGLAAHIPVSATGTAPADPYRAQEHR